MWHFLYIVAFAVLAFLAIANLFRNLMLLGSQARRSPSSTASPGDRPSNDASSRPVPHPELLDAAGNLIREPLLVMRSISMQDAREQLDALYNGQSPKEEGDSDESPAD